VTHDSLRYINILTYLLPDVSPDSVFSVSEEQVRRAVLSLPAGSSGGPDGMCPQHLKDLVTCRDLGRFFMCSYRFHNRGFGGPLSDRRDTVFFR